MEQNQRENPLLDTDAMEEENQLTAEALNFSLHRKNRPKKVWVFALLAGLVLFFAIFQVYKNLNDPFKIELPDFLLAQLDGSGKSEWELIEDLKNKDTDGDGLTDYEEIYIYGTSIFLEDTSGDGISDYDAVRMGIDPLCPQGQNCSLLRLITPQTRLAEIVQTIRLNPNLTLAQASATEFRKFLIENGMEAEELADLTDEDLLDIFYIWQESGILSEEEWLTEVGPEEVREFLLLQPGVDHREIESLTDEELLKIRDQLFFQ
ncbi:MAG: hypothetical protein PHO91_04505 [Patescibacteria group bacterium]|nr:hypothetical protein [Patescibacteria group bacterium]